MSILFNGNLPNLPEFESRNKKRYFAPLTFELEIARPQNLLYTLKTLRLHQVFKQKNTLQKGRCRNW